jgi:hypothetical protein
MTRDEYITGLHQLADWLTLNPTAPYPEYNDRVLLSLTTNTALQSFADEFDLPVATDADGNTSAELHFGTLTYHAYGYADFSAHQETQAAESAEAWAQRSGHQIIPVAPQLLTESVA